MIDVSLKGIRCRAAQEILDLEGTIGISTEGTIVYELEGQGEQLVNVQWDTGASSLVSSEEIVITDHAVIWQ
jgi:transposase